MTTDLSSSAMGAFPSDESISETYLNGSAVLDAPPISHVTDTTGRVYHLTSVAGYGGQGLVCRESSGEFMVKLIAVADDERRQELRRRYEVLFTMGERIPREARLILPDALLQAPHVGYIMKRVRGHQPLTALLVPPRDALSSNQDASRETPFAAWYNRTTGGLRARLLIGMMLARTFEHLHRSGYAYCDLSDSNVLVARDPARQSICLIDTDNLSVPQEATSLVMGTPLYMAPEVLLGSRHPDALTDCHGLAALLFQMLRFGHPFLGDTVRAGTLDDEESALRGEKPFVDHPDDRSNQSTALMPCALTVTPPIEALFQRAFVDGLHQRTRRPSPLDWEHALLQALYITMVCPTCRASFYVPSPLPNTGRAICPWCAAEVSCPHLLTFFDVTRQHGRDKTRRVSTMLASVGVSRKIPARLARYAVRGEAGDMAVAQLEDVTFDGSCILHNLSDEPLFLARPGDSQFVLVRPGGAAPFNSEHVLYFSDPRLLLHENVTSDHTSIAIRCARLRPSLCPVTNADKKE